jgi:hypothetical protein
MMSVTDSVPPPQRFLEPGWHTEVDNRKPPDGLSRHDSADTGTSMDVETPSALRRQLPAEELIGAVPWVAGPDFTSLT